MKTRIRLQVRHSTNLRRYVVALAAIFLIASQLSSAQEHSGKAPTVKVAAAMPPKVGYAPVRGLKLYYEVHGDGRPLVLLHGSFMTIDLTYGQVIPELSKTRRVIALELQGHGRTADIDRPITFESMADDVAELLKYLKVESADVFGYSMGGTVALQVAARHPEAVRKLIIASAVFKSDGWSPETRAAIANLKPEVLERTPIKKEYDRLAPDPKHFPQFVEKVKQVSATPFDFTAEAKSLQCPTLIILGDSDGIRIEHGADLFRLRGGAVNGDLAGATNSQFAILPGTSHVGVMLRTDWLLSIVTNFLDAPVQ